MERVCQEQPDEMLRDVEMLAVEVETRTILTRRSADELFHAARELKADRVVVGGEASSYGSAGRFESALKDVVGSLPCNFVVFFRAARRAVRLVLPFFLRDFTIK